MVLTALSLILAVTAAPDAVFLGHHVTVTFHSDGVITERTLSTIMPLTGRGVHKYSSISLSYREGMEELVVQRAYVGHWRGGRGSSEASRATGPHPILSRTNRLESSLRETVLTMPGVEVGDTVIVDVARRIHMLPLSEVYAFSFSPMMSDSVVHTTFRTIDEKGVIRYFTHSGDHFHFRNLSPAPSHPLAAWSVEWISVSTGSPEQLSMQASMALDIPEHGHCPELLTIVETHGPDPWELRDWVAENINYTGADAGVWPGWSPRSPAETLEDGSGVCRDRAILLTWLLRHSGHEAYPALIQTRGETPNLVDARTFDHMITVFRLSPEEPWRYLDPTPRAIPHGAGISFGLRGSTYLPLVPWGAGLSRIPSHGWNDSLRITLHGSLNRAEGRITGTLSAEASGAPLELMSALYLRSASDRRTEMFRRFFGAVECDSVFMEGSRVVVRGSWKTPDNGEMVILPGLREISLSGTRTAAMLLCSVPDSFFVDSPSCEVLQAFVHVGDDVPELAVPVYAPGYTCTMAHSDGVLFYRETADVTAESPHLTETLLYRSGTAQRTVVFP